MSYKGWRGAGRQGEKEGTHQNQQVESIHFLCIPQLSAATHLNFVLLCWQFTNKNTASQQNRKIKQDKDDFMVTWIQLFTIMHGHKGI
jgi:hypothetical protein